MPQFENWITQAILTMHVLPWTVDTLSTMRDAVMHKVACSFLDVASVSVNPVRSHQTQEDTALRITYMSTVPNEDTITPTDMVRFMHYNHTNNITGILVYVHGLKLYIQSIEGPPDKIEELFVLIRADTRHQSLRVLDRSTGMRIYSQWDMKKIPMDRGAFDDLLSDTICSIASEKILKMQPIH